MQAPHQLAQKLTTSGLPAATSEMGTGPPDSRGSTLQVPGMVWPTSMRARAVPQSRSRVHEGEDKEGNAHAERIHEEQEGALRRRWRVGGNGEDSGEHRADAGGPAERERHAERYCTDRSGTDAVEIEALLPVEERQAQHAERRQPHGDDEDAGDPGDEGPRAEPEGGQPRGRGPRPP